MKKRILHLITSLDVGGTEMMLLKTMPQLQKTFDNTVCCILGRGPIGDRLKETGITVTYLNLQGITDIGVFFRLWRVIREARPDILSTYLIHADLLGRVIGRLCGVTIIVAHQRGSLLGWQFLRVVDRLTKYLVTHYTVQTMVAKKEIQQQLGLRDSQATVIPNFIDWTASHPSRRTVLRNQFGIKATDTVIVCVSRLRQGKGHEYLVEAFHRLIPTNPTAWLLIVGDGDRQAEIEKLVNYGLGRSRIIMLGQRDDIREILSECDIFVLPTLGEGMSNAVLEAMASGLAVITTNIPVNKEVVTDMNDGLLVPTRDTDAIIEKLSVLLSDHRLRAALGKAARQTVERRFTAEVVLRKAIVLYQTLLKC